MTTRESSIGKLDAETIQQYEKAHVFYPWAAQKAVNPVIIDRGEGCHIYDLAGKKYLDCSSMLVFTNLGHSEARVIEAIHQQALRLPTSGPSFATEAKARLAKLIADITPGDITKTFFSTSGSEANEGAIKIARLATGKDKIIARYRGYHGATYGAMALSNDFRNWSSEPAIPGVVHCLDPYCYRCPFGMTYPACDLQCAKHVEDVIRFEGGAKRVAAFWGEPIVGANGVIVPPDGYWQKVREICDRYEVLLVCDEVMAGFGRTGKWFSIDHWGVVPDILISAKGITGGYIPLGITSMREHVARAFEEKVYDHGHTYSGHALAMAAGVAAIEVYVADNLIEHSATMGTYLLERALELKDKHPSVGDVRGKGLFVGMELVKDRTTKEPMHDTLRAGPQPPSGKLKVLAEAMKNGVYCLPGVASVITLAPPLPVTKDEIDFAIDVFDKALSIADAEVRRS